MTILTEARAAFTSLQAPYVEPTEYPVIGLSLHTIPPGYVFSAEKFYRGYKPKKPKLKTMAEYVQRMSEIQREEILGMRIHIPFLDAD